MTDENYRISDPALREALIDDLERACELENSIRKMLDARVPGSGRVRVPGGVDGAGDQVGGVTHQVGLDPLSPASRFADVVRELARLAPPDGRQPGTYVADYARAALAGYHARLAELGVKTTPDG